MTEWPKNKGDRTPRSCHLLRPRGGRAHPSWPPATLHCTPRAFAAQWEHVPCGAPCTPLTRSLTWTSMVPFRLAPPAGRASESQK